MTWVYRMHGVPVPVPGDIDQMQESGQMSRMPDCPPPHIKLSEYSVCSHFTRSTSQDVDQRSCCNSKRCLVGSLLCLSSGSLVGCFGFGCGRTALGLGLGFGCRPDGLKQGLAIVS